MNPANIPCVVTIAGTDPSGGAGVQADIKAISACGAYAASVITALVAQNTQGVVAIEDVAASFVRRQIEVVFDDLDIKTVKIGMLHEARIIETVVACLERYKPNYVVCDPVMVAKDSSLLLDLSALTVYKSLLLPKVDLITPNLFEAEYLLGQHILSVSDMEAAARHLGREFNLSVLVKGGHLASEEASDVLYQVEEETCHWFHASRINTKNTHGTGCTLSSAIASYLAQGKTLYDAVAAAKHYITEAIRFGASQKIGHGAGPVDHFYFLPNRSHLTK